MDPNRPLITINHAMAFVDSLLAAGFTITGPTKKSPKAIGLSAPSANEGIPLEQIEPITARLKEARDKNWKGRGFLDLHDYVSKQIAHHGK
jgi:hypothetical protein